MNTIVRYLAGGALALSSQGLFAASFGLSGVMSTGGEPMAMVRLQDVQPVGAKRLASLQQVDRTHKSDRLPDLNVDPALAAGNEFAANQQGTRKLIQPAIKPAKRDVEPKLPEGCSSSVSPLSDRIAANQASNCITALELPFTVAAAE